MRFRPCIDIHDGKVKQIVGGSLSEYSGASSACENYVAEADAGYYAALYKKRKLQGGHIILLNASGTPEYKADMEQAAIACAAYPGGMQIGGGITADNASEMLQLGASHVIVTSYVFRNGMIDYSNLERLSSAIGPERLVLDMSCRKKGTDYYVVTDRWQKFTEVRFTSELLISLKQYCDEFLVHAVDVEGHTAGIEDAVVELLGSCDSAKTTYAGGIASVDDIDKLERIGEGKVDFTIGSALDIFGGTLSFDNIAQKYI